MKVVIWIGLALAGLAVGQQAAQQQKKESAPAQKSEPESLFSGQLGIRSSKKTKESATLGFNGIDPSGKVDQAMMATTPGDKDREKVAGLDKNRPSDQDVDHFIQEGGLKK